MLQIMGLKPVPMRVGIGENLANNHEIIGIIKHANGNRFLGNAVYAIKQQNTVISAKSPFSPSGAVILAKRLLGGQVKAFIRNRGRRTPAKTGN